MTYILLLFFFDAINIIGLIDNSMEKEDLMFIRNFYIFVCFVVVFVNIKSDFSILQFILYICYKGIILIVVMNFYDFKNSLNKYLLYDIYMIILIIGITVINVILKKTLLKYIDKLNGKNIALINHFKNIFNTLKSPMISLNFKKNVVFFNASFTSFIKNNYHGKLGEIKYLFDEINDLDINNEFYLYDLNDIQNEDKLFFDKIENSLKLVKNEKKCKKFLILKNKILILNKIFKTFKLETLINMVIESEYFNIFGLLREKRVFLDKDQFDHIGTYKIANSEKLVEINWRKTIYSTDKLVLDIMFQ